MRNLDDQGPLKVEYFLGCNGSANLMGSLLLILALIGAGYLYSSYKEKKLASDVPRIMAAYEGLLDDSVKDPEDRAKLKQALGIIGELIYKYNPTGINLKAVKEIERRKMLLQSSQTSGEEK
jgi:hypothetical protein